MEDILIALLQCGAEFLGCFLEFIVQCVIEANNWIYMGDILDAFIRMMGDVMGCFYGTWPGMNSDTRANWLSAFYFVVGLVTGIVSLHFYHDVFLRKSATRLLTLGLGPIVSGCVSWIAARYRAFMGAPLRPDYCFWWALFFSLGLCLIRFGFCHRPEI